MNPETEFSVPGYQLLVQKLLSLGYVPRDFSDNYCPANGDLFLRHDVDYCLGSALNMAKAEQDIGVKATYFILMRSPLFNPFGYGEFEKLEAIVDTGARIGLHFDASYYPEMSFEDLEKQAEMESGLLASLVGQEVNLLSFHKPPPAVRSLKSSFGGLVHTSQPCFMDNITYCSDTLAKFSYGHPLEMAEVQQIKPLQFLTHPIWWSEPSDLDGLGKLEKLLARHAKTADDAIARSVTAYQDRVKERSTRLTSTKDISK